LSEAFPGIPRFDLPPATPRAASAIILWREGATGREVFWVRRGKNLRFAGGFCAFPGGKVDRADEAIPIAGAAGLEAALLVSACRELFEETGILFAEGAERLSTEARAALRRELLGGRPLADLLAQADLRLDPSALTPAGRWVTPSTVPVRFDARFFLAQPPPGQEAVVWPGELTDGGWISCAEALSLWRTGRVLLHPPNRWAVECLAKAPPPGCLEALRSPPHCVDFVTQRIDFQENLLLVALRTPTLPPATHTNTYVVGDRELALVDPGSPDPDEQEHLFRVLGGLAAEGRRLTEIWLTHHHSDHVGGLEAVWNRLRVPVRAHPLTGARMPISCIDTHEGDLLFGRWRALHTPGHARGHLCFWDEGTGALLAGDMVSSVSTIVIDPPEGDMSDYLGSLERLRDLGPRTLYPAHGMPVPDAVGKLEEYLAHRRMREGKVRRALEPGGTLEEITRRAYDDTPEFLHPLAARSCLASLEKLAREGVARVEGAEWMLA
jgi:glyoxylase-like metal-dependent hydrolase (beta-lactamase superfamily II)/8-oxo-dGTP pyrophosphatase MutT (NUDIX family)